MRRGLCVLLLLALGACGATDAQPPPVATLVAEAEQRVEAGRWAEAADLYGQAFALLEPVDAERTRRARLALERARALAPAGRPLDAIAWLRWAERIDPSLRYVSYERARVLDGTYPSTAQPEQARTEYERFLAAVEAAGAAEEDAPFVEYAEVRLRYLSR